MSVAKIPRGKTHEYCLRVAIYNTDQLILREIRKRWGGHLSGVASRRVGWKPGYQLIWTNAAAARILSDVGPLLRVKAIQSQTMVRFQRAVSKSRRRRDRLGRLLPLSSRDRSMRERLYHRLKSLNRTGPNNVARRQRRHGPVARDLFRRNISRGSSMARDA